MFTTTVVFAAEKGPADVLEEVQELVWPLEELHNGDYFRYTDSERNKEMYPKLSQLLTGLLGLDECLVTYTW